MVDVGVAPFLSMCSGVVNNTPLLIGCAFRCLQTCATATFRVDSYLLCHAMHRGGQQRVFGYRWETLSNYFDAAIAEAGASRFIELQPELGFDCAYVSDFVDLRSGSASQH